MTDSKRQVGTTNQLTIDEEAIRTVGDRGKLFGRERKGWVGFVEWKDHPDKKLGPIPGTRWKMWHHAVGDEITQIPGDPWDIVLKEKHPDILRLLQFPYNGEPPKRFFTDREITLNPLHLSGTMVTPRLLTLDGLMDQTKFPHIEKVVTIQCSGTRLIEQILKYPDDKVMNYLVSVPWSKVKENEVLLAWEMNGEPMPRIHGCPLRLVILGYIDARSAKWVYRTKAIEKPSRAPVQSQKYLYFPQQVGKHELGLTDWIQAQKMSVSSAVMSPWTKQVPKRIELSADGGFNWYTVPFKNMSKKRKWIWRTYKFDLPYDLEGRVEIVYQCWDNALNTQPPDVRTAWNWVLYVTNSCHRISVYSVNKSSSKIYCSRCLKNF
ncbi:hypothetical protein COCMIDRAFT_34179 [Bipolaris oryzae ATCC 44560]|uniref:Sulfite oxidase n=1 Tax=Bipolaris oryzae ATCC 44560 TaxID=930090 RepID=W6ZEK5_COCMI|nr:uncharacterized protein COCMIDRAFT_34179 [Bipolaris oryzae ATCC 44560]EUC48303.1 hypothetical protein COCMIDRAFT_34179 [Bipolaris oryzae ATCC 44560]